LELDPKTGSSSAAGNGAIGWGERAGRTMNEPPLNKFLAINSTNTISRSNESRWLLEYMFSIGESECFPNLLYYDTFHSTAGQIFFNTSITTGKMPNLTDPGACPLPLGAIKVIGHNETNAACPLISNPRPAPIACTSKFDAETADQISAAMVTSSHCETVSGQMEPA